MPDLPASSLPKTRIHPAQAQDTLAAQAILLEYASTLPAAELQTGLAHEAAQWPGDYAAPRGIFLLAWVDDLLAGCCAMRPLDDSDHMGAAEMRRLYVRPAFRSLGLGKALADAAMDFARRQGYACVLLDTLDTMGTARQLYEDLDFYEIAPYYNSPLPGAHYLKREM
ncbi:MAG: GNAT family N-acetyltransferase [Brachymonas sp.]|jgi:ribosomal protein S18 acetylase RimI-like enzyme